jgi:uncharacterized repeat protein (TIGR03803 family)
VEKENMRKTLPRYTAIASLTVAVISSTEAAHAWTANNLYFFADEFGFGLPAGVTLKKGALYGVVSNGGTLGCGSVFKLTEAVPTWSRVVLHQFAGGAKDGCEPLGELTFGSDGALYGTSYGGGLENCTGIDSPTCGTVFRLLPRPDPNPWKIEVLYKFKGGADGFYPGAGVVFGSDGKLYGTTAGFCGPSTVFQLSPPAAGKTKWTHKVLYRGAYAITAPVTFDSDGNLYMTEGGGCGAGQVFRLEPPNWHFRQLLAFSGGDDGGDPYAGVVFDDAGVLYGTTKAGGSTNNGTVFSLTPNGKRWKHKVLHSFAGAPNDGADPRVELVRDSKGNLYGTTNGGGANNYGAVFQLKPGGGEGVLWSFALSGPEGNNPVAPLTLDKDNLLYGTTFYSNVFRLTK